MLYARLRVFNAEPESAELPDLFLLRLTVKLRDQIMTPCIGRLFLLHMKRMRLRILVMPNTGYLPTDLYARLTSRYPKTTVRNLFCDV